MRRKDAIDLVPDATPDFRVKGGQLGGCPVFDAAHAYWHSDRAKVAGITYEDVIRLAYLKEARLTDGLVVSLATGDPLNDAEVMHTDIYELSVMWDDGVFSKTFTEGKIAIKDKKSLDDLEAERRAVFPALPGWPNRFEGMPCKNCGESVRYFRGGGCVKCQHHAQTRANMLRAAKVVKREKGILGDPCPVCTSRRKTAKGNCFVCAARRHQATAKARREATPRVEGAEHLYIGNPCRKCAGTHRYVSNGDCATCNRPR